MLLVLTEILTLFTNSSEKLSIFFSLSAPTNGKRLLKTQTIKAEILKIIIGKSLFLRVCIVVLFRKMENETKTWSWA